jgi:hypothetical protein
VAARGLGQASVGERLHQHNYEIHERGGAGRHAMCLQGVTGGLGCVGVLGLLSRVGCSEA